MIKNIRKIVNALLVGVGLTFAPMMVPVFVSAQSTTNNTPDIGHSIDCGVNLQLDTSSNACDTTGGEEKLQSVLNTVITVFTAVIVIIILFNFLRAAATMGGSGGKENKVGEASKSITYGVIGLVLLVLVQVLGKFVVHKISTAGGSSPT